ncbi:CAAX protease self-immunity [Palleronia marisminoris]|uniref:CAAX amino terminal protease self-immunity n=1 Tax=Palleronia marisminoris TaxID=315423 RepID=A0A1Y5T998_9RHOB|nr:CPBP family glutamic-type intramembrane protease [Palleronia marisminoris]SFH15973.1 CAAX protease self-immunity [Palleronia marisminoris]SLN55185.1 CAAX amino terminal protease self-immunity [Palleronia marisminoris]
MTPPSPARLRVEFVLLFVVAPVAVAVLLPASSLFPVLFALVVLSGWLLFRTPGFVLSKLWQGRVSWFRVIAFAGIAAGLSAVLVTSLRPEAWLMPGRAAPWLLVAILLLYPLLSALPQELIFRTLFFERYGPILPDGTAALILNAAIFSLAHLIYWNWIVAALTFAGSLAFAHSYRDRRSFPEALAMHAVAGNILFALGMGAWFYSGNVTPPF